MKIEMAWFEKMTELQRGMYQLGKCPWCKGKITFTHIEMEHPLVWIALRQ